MKLNFRLWWRRPQDPKHLGKEALELATTILRFSDGPDVGQITNPVRAGFFHNFQTEHGGPNREPWAQLAERTQAERELLGFSPEHPILKRAGSYEKSWTRRTAHGHFERQHRHGQLMGMGLAGQNKVTIHVGSIDYRVPTLEGGMAMPEHLVERERMLQRAGGMPVMQGTGAVPPRPVRFIVNHYLDKIGGGIRNLLDGKIKEVKGP